MIKWYTSHLPPLPSNYKDRLMEMLIYSTKEKHMSQGLKIPKRSIALGGRSEHKYDALDWKVGTTNTIRYGKVNSIRHTCCPN